jgi:hypothetical protein
LPADITSLKMQEALPTGAPFVFLRQHAFAPELMRCMIAGIGPNATMQPGAARSNAAALKQHREAADGKVDTF